jgi:hypothetical protein
MGARDNAPAQHGDATTTTVEMRAKGHWIRVPAVEVNQNKIVATGTWLRVASLRGEAMMETALEHPGIYIEKLKGAARGVLKADIFTFAQKLPVTDPEYAYPLEWESVAAIPLSTFREWWEQLPQETRKNVRRAHKRGVVVTVKSELHDDLIEGIREVNDDSLIRQGNRNAYYGKSAEETRKLYGEFLGRCDFVCAYFDNRLIGFLHLVYRGQVAAILNLTTKPSQFDKRPANALVAKAVELCELKGISHISYGLYHYGNKRGDPLLTFKVRNGFQEILMPRYFIPLNWWGKLCLRAKLHRGLIGILPRAVIRVGIQARSLLNAFLVRRSTATAVQPEL